MTMDERMYYKDHLKNLEDEITNLSSNLTPSLSDEILLVEKKIEFEKILIEIEVKQNKTVSKCTEEELLYLIEVPSQLTFEFVLYHLSFLLLNCSLKTPLLHSLLSFQLY